MTPYERLPDWVIWVQMLGPSTAALATSLIAMGVAVISWRQWTTARDKVWVDLFDKRYQLMLDFLELAYFDPRKRSDMDPKVVSAMTRAHFLLGPDASEDLKKLLDVAGDKDYADKRPELGKVISDAFEAELAVPLRRKFKLK